MSESDGYIAGLTVWVFEPRSVPVRLGARRTGCAIDAASLFITKPQAGQDIGNQAQAFPTGSFIMPEFRLVLVHAAKKFSALVGLQYGRDFFPRADCGLPVPLWDDPGVHAQ